MRHSRKKAAAVGFLAFLVLWIVGGVRGSALPYPQPVTWPVLLGDETNVQLPQANNLRQIGLAQTPLPLMLEQPEVEGLKVHEKRARLSVGTTNFDGDLALVRSQLAAQQAVVFNER